MNELSQHIENLLLENDCVIVPDLGGFIAHHTSATKITDENKFLPPTRIIGFNPQLKMNDGMLVQSYMSVYNTSFPDATKLVEREVKQLQEKLHENGKVNLANIGELRYTIHETYDFIPYDNRITTPYLYGLESFEMQELPTLKKPYTIKSPTTFPTTSKGRSQRRRIAIRLNRSYIPNAAAIVAIFVLFFLLSTPVKNTEVMNENYAQLLPEELFEKIEKQSLAITPVFTHAHESKSHVQTAPKQTIQDKKNVVPVAVKEIKVKQEQIFPAVLSTKKNDKVAISAKPIAPAPAPQIETRQNNANKATHFHIIVASMGTEKDAQEMARQLMGQGYKDAQALIGNGRMRVSIQSFPTQKEAYEALQQVRKNKSFEGAWVLRQ